VGDLTPASILAGLRAHGAHLHLVGDRVHVDGVRPEDLPPELVAAAREHRAGILEELDRENPIALVLDVFAGAEVIKTTGPVCSTCRQPMPPSNFTQCFTCTYGPEASASSKVARERIETRQVADGLDPSKSVKP